MHVERRKNKKAKKRQAKVGLRPSNFQTRLANAARALLIIKSCYDVKRSVHFSEETVVRFAVPPTCEAGALPFEPVAQTSQTLNLKLQPHRLVSKNLI